MTKISAKPLQGFIWLTVMVYYNVHMPLVPKARLTKKMQHASKCFTKDALVCCSPQAFSMCEFFAGDGHVGRSAKFAFYSTAQLDIAYGKATVRKGKQNSFDMTTAAGLASLVSHWNTLQIFVFFNVFFQYRKPSMLTPMHALLFRLCVWVLLNTDPLGFLALFAVVCTSFSAVNVGTSKRSPATPWGNCNLPHVRASWSVRLEKKVYLCMIVLLDRFDMGCLCWCVL